jgi:hypothetical protein
MTMCKEPQALLRVGEGRIDAPAHEALFGSSSAVRARNSTIAK